MIYIKRATCIVIFAIFTAAVSYGQEKFALVIGNSNYTHFGTLRNPVNDANDIKDVLDILGFSVDLLLNGSLDRLWPM